MMHDKGKSWFKIQKLISVSSRERNVAFFADLIWFEPIMQFLFT